MPPKRSPIPLPLALPLVPLYAVAVARRNRRFDSGRAVKTAAVPVISIGNITVGGTGKTPVVQHVAKVLRMAGKRPGIVLRGYGHKLDGLSDEHAEHKHHAPDVPVVSNPSRYEGISLLLASAAGPKPDVVILDDGFQHRQLKRKLDLVLIDVTRNPFRDRLLPAGWLREPVASLARASAVILTRVDQVSDSERRAISDAVETVTGAPPIAETRHAWAPELEALINARDTTKPIAYLAGKRALITCGLGNPGPFINQARTAGAVVAGEVIFKDHAPMGSREAERIITAARNVEAQIILCTAKDWTKLRRFKRDRWPVPVLRPIVEIQFESGRDELARRLGAAVATPRGKHHAPHTDTTAHDTHDAA